MIRKKKSAKATSMVKLESSDSDLESILAQLFDASGNYTPQMVQLLLRMQKNGCSVTIEPRRGSVPRKNGRSPISTQTVPKIPARLQKDIDSLIE